MNILRLNKLSVLVRASEAFASGELAEVKERAERLYLGKRYPFVISADYPYPLHLFSPRLSAMLVGGSNYPDAEDLENNQQPRKHHQDDFSYRDQEDCGRDTGPHV